MELLKTKATRTRVSEVFYFVFNAILPIAVLLLVRGFDPPYLAIALVLMSKWRILALRPRFWSANIKANAVDLVVGLSTVGLLYLSQSDLLLQILLTLAYGAWLLVVKPRSGTHGILLQAGIAQFLGVLTLFHFSAIFPEVIVILGCWLIGYVCARHVVSNYEEPHLELWAGLWGLVLSQIGWLLYRWTTVYNLGLPIQIPQIALIMLVVGFCASRMYHLSKHGRMTQSVLQGTIIFGAALLAVILFFSPWDPTV